MINPEKIFSLKTHIGFVLIFAAAFMFRYDALTGSEVILPLRADAGDYIHYAYNLVRYHTYSHYHAVDSAPKPDALRPPGFPLFASLFISKTVTNRQLKNILFCQTLINSVATGLLFYIAVFLMPFIPAFIVGLLVAISPPLINTNIYFLSESLYTSLLIIFFLGLAQENENNSHGKSVVLYLLAGLVFGYAAFTRVSLEYFLVIQAALILTLTRRFSKTKTLCFILGAGIIIFSWSIRNYYQIGEFSDPTLAITTIHHGMYPDFMYKGKPETYRFPYKYDPDSKKIAASFSSVLGYVYKRFKNEPVRYLKWYLVGKVVTFFSWDTVQGMGKSFIYPVKKSPYFTNNLFRATYWVSYILHPVTILLCLFGILFLAANFIRNADINEHRMVLLSMSALMIYMIVLHMVGAPFPRYSIPLTPEVYILAAYFVWRLAVIFRRKSISGIMNN